MARKQKLKVFRTSIGFHDAYVAAPSRKAALEAWGSKSDLFATGLAEEVRDEALMAQPLASPGIVLRKLRGTAADQFAALKPDLPKRSRLPKAVEKPTKPKAEPPPKSKPRPSRSALDAAERKLADLLAGQAAARSELDAREQALRRERRDLESAQQDARQRAETLLEAARNKHAQALMDWSAAQR